MLGYALANKYGIVWDVDGVGVGLSRRALLLGLAGCGVGRSAVQRAVVPVGPVLPALAGASVKLAFQGFNYAHLHRAGFGYGSERSKVQLQVLREIGVDWIALNPFVYMPALDKPDLRWGGDPTLSDTAIIAEIAAIKALGMRVMLKPHIWAGSFLSLIHI